MLAIKAKIKHRAGGHEASSRIQPIDPLVVRKRVRHVDVDATKAQRYGVHAGGRTGRDPHSQAAVHERVVDMAALPILSAEQISFIAFKYFNFVEVGATIEPYPGFEDGNYRFFGQLHNSDSESECSSNSESDAGGSVFGRGRTGAGFGRTGSCSGSGSGRTGAGLLGISGLRGGKIPNPGTSSMIHSSG